MHCPPFWGDQRLNGSPCANFLKSRFKAFKTHPELLNLHPNWEACCLSVTEEKIKTNALSPQTLLSEPFSDQGTADGQFLASSDFILRLILDLPPPAGLPWVPERGCAKCSAGVNVPCG